MFSLSRSFNMVRSEFVSLSYTIILSTTTQIQWTSFHSKRSNHPLPYREHVPKALHEDYNTINNRNQSLPLIYGSFRRELEYNFVSSPTQQPVNPAKKLISMYSFDESIWRKRHLDKLHKLEIFLVFHEIMMIPTWYWIETRGINASPEPELKLVLIRCSRSILLLISFILEDEHCWCTKWVERSDSHGE